MSDKTDAEFVKAVDKFRNKPILIGGDDLPEYTTIGTADKSVKYIREDIVKQSNESLLAQLEEIKEIAHPIVTNLYANEYDQTFRDVKDLHNLAIALNKRPAQSLNTLKARIVEKCADCVLAEADFPIGLISSDKNVMLRRILDNMRKYSAEDE